MNEATRIQPQAVELGASGEEFQNLHEFVQKARANLNQNSWDYIVGAAETETTMRRNRMALDEIAFRPRVLRNVAKVDASVEHCVLDLLRDVAQVIGSLLGVATSLREIGDGPPDQ